MASVMGWPNMNKFNVHLWDGRNWNYLCTVKANTERDSVEMAASRYGLNNRYQAYPHINNQEVA